MNTAGYQTASQLVEECLSVEKVERIMLKLRDVGMKGRYILKKHIKEEMTSKKHFIVAMLASLGEIRNQNYSCIHRFEKYLQNRSGRMSQRFLFQERIVVLLNAPLSNAHGEARFLDPDGCILSAFIDKRYSSGKRHEVMPFLAKMKENFYIRFGHENAIILLFSFYIPCTLPAFMCANLIGQFALRSENAMIVAYATRFETTNMHLSYAYMNQKNVYILRVPQLEPPESFKKRSDNRLRWRMRKVSTFLSTGTKRRPEDDDNDYSDENDYSNDDECTLVDSSFEGAFSTIGDYSRSKKINKNQGNRKSILRTVDSKKYKKQRQQKNYHEMFWLLD